uniref:CRAL-TRIO domain-containing protein n=2 Tax=Parascaris univalens TaxID=6257 RepID=A0A915BX60_PARUN
MSTSIGTYMLRIVRAFNFPDKTMSAHTGAAPHLTLEERNLVTQLRDRLIHVMPEGIPRDLDTDLNLARWIRGYQHNIDRITKVFPVYVASRKAAGFDRSDHPERFFDIVQLKAYLPFIASSRLDDRVWSDEHNAFLFVERACSQPKEFVKTMRSSDYLMHCFGYMEMLLQFILRREKAQEENKGPVQFIVLFDLGEVNLTDYLNPMSAQIKLWQLRSDLWQDWYPQMVQRIFVVNPPRLISVLWSLARMFLNDENYKLIEIARNKKDLIKYLPPWFVPKEFGGEFINKVPPGDESGASRRRKITADDHLRSHEVYRRKGVERPKPTHRDIAPEGSFKCTVDVPAEHALLWDFTTNGEVDFAIYANENEHHMVYPRLRLISTKVPEDGCIENLPPGQYLFEFRNRSSFFNLKLDYCISVAPL